LVSMAWLANTDISPCTGSKAVLEYLAKYVSKPEKQTESYEELMKRLLPSINTNRPVLSAVTKLMNQLIAERDWSAQEVCHILLDLPLQHGSRQVLNVDVRPEDQQDQRFVFGDSGDGEETRETCETGEIMSSEVQGAPGESRESQLSGIPVEV